MGGLRNKCEVIEMGLPFTGGVYVLVLTLRNPIARYHSLGGINLFSHPPSLQFLQIHFSHFPTSITTRSA